MSRKYRSKTKNPSSRRFPWLWLAVSVAVLLIVAGLVVTWTGPKTASAPGTLTGGQAKSAPAAPQSTGDGGPRLAVDQAVIDEGYIKLGTPIRTTFRLKNTGNQPLHILGEPVVQLVEGC